MGFKNRKIFCKNKLIANVNEISKTTPILFKNSPKRFEHRKKVEFSALFIIYTIVVSLLFLAKSTYFHNTTLE